MTIDSGRVIGNPGLPLYVKEESVFAAPWAFLALLSLPALAGLYYLRNAYRRVPVSSLMLWLEQVDMRSSGLRVRRLQTPLLFFLELAALSLLGVAATGPRLQTSLGRWPLVVVLDDSYSMLAGDEDAPRRLAEIALERELTFDSTQGVRFVLAGAFPRALGEPVTNLVEVRRLLAGWHCRAPAARLSEALGLAAELGGEKVRILVVSDHPAPADLIPGRALWWSFGKPRANMAIVQAGRLSQDGQERIALEIANLSEVEKTTILTLETAAAGQAGPSTYDEVYRDTLTLAAGESRRLLLQFKKTLPQLRVRLGDDALAIDNTAWLLPETKPVVRVEVRIENESLQALVDKTLKATGQTLPVTEKPHLLITDDAEAPVIGPETWLLQLLQEKEAEAFLGPFVLDRTHPLTEGLGLAGVVWGGGKTQTLPGTPVVMAGNVPLLTDTETLAGQHRLRLRLRPDMATLPESPAWPVLFWNLVHWRSTELPGLRRASVRLGETTTLKVASDVDAVTMIFPAAEGPEAKGPDPRRFAVFNQKVTLPAAAVGVHKILAGQQTYLLAASTLNREESDLSACVTGRWGEWDQESYSASLWHNLAWILLLATLGVMTLHMVLATRG